MSKCLSCVWNSGEDSLHRDEAGPLLKKPHKLMRCLRFHSCIQTTCSLSCTLLTPCLFYPICHPSICRQVPTQCVLSNLLAVCSAGIHTGSWIRILFWMPSFRTQNEQGERLNACSELATAFLSEPLHRLCRYTFDISLDFDAATEGSDLLMSCTHWRNQPRRGQM